MRLKTFFVKTIESDEYKPMIVNSLDDYEAVLKLFRIKEDKKIDMKFPRALPFSRGFPFCCDHIKQFIIGFYHFAEGFDQQNNEMDDLLKKVQFSP
jgi:exocyst complex component 6